MDKVREKIAKIIYNTCYKYTKIKPHLNTKKMKPPKIPWHEAHENKIETIEKAVEEILALFPQPSEEEIEKMQFEYLNTHGYDLTQRYLRKGLAHATYEKLSTNLAEKGEEKENEYCKCGYKAGTCIPVEDIEYPLCPKCHKVMLAENKQDPKPQERIEPCGICGGKLTEIRGRYPHTENRKVCPTCCAERLDQIRGIADKSYGLATTNY